MTNNVSHQHPDTSVTNEDWKTFEGLLPFPTHFPPSFSSSYPLQPPSPGTHPNSPTFSISSTTTLHSWATHTTFVSSLPFFDPLYSSLQTQLHHPSSTLTTQIKKNTLLDIISSSIFHIQYANSKKTNIVHRNREGDIFIISFNLHHLQIA